MVLHSSTGRAWHRLRQGGGSDRGAGARFPAEPPMQKKKTTKKKTYARMVRRGTRDEKRSLKRCRRTKEERRREEKPPAVCKWTPSLRALPFILFCVDVGLSSLIIPSPNTDE